MNGEVLAGRYRLLAPLGRGGAGEVWRAEDSVLARPVAVKLLRRLEGDPVDAVERFRTEARASARLTHPNVVATYDVGTANGQVFLVMELVDGPDLAQLLRSKGLPPDQFVADIALQGARALDAAHAAGIVHRDVKPGNLLLAPDGTLKMTDFGIAQATGMDGSTGPVLLGTAGYVSPEQVRGERATPASDWYAFGCVLYELLEGAPPFVGTDVMNVMHQHLDTPPPAVRQTETAPGLADLVMSLLSKDPAARPSSAAAIAAYLNGSTAQGSAADTRTRVLPTLPTPALGATGASAGGAGYEGPALAGSAGAGAEAGYGGAADYARSAGPGAGDASAEGGYADAAAPPAAGILPAGAIDSGDEAGERQRRGPLVTALVGAGVVVVGVVIAVLLRQGVTSDSPAQAGGVPSITPSATVKTVVTPKATPTPSKTPSKKPTPKKSATKKPSPPRVGSPASLRLLAQLLRDHEQERGMKTAREAAKDLDQAAKALEEDDVEQAARQFQQARQRLLAAQREGRWRSTPQISAWFAVIGSTLSKENDGDGDGDRNDGDGWNRN